MLRYPALRFVSLCYKILAVIGAVGGTLIVIAIKDDFPRMFGNSLGMVMPYIVLFILWFVCVTIFAGGELIALWVDLEFNTRALRERQQQREYERIGRGTGGGLAPVAPDAPQPNRGYGAPAGRPDNDRRTAAQVGRDAQIRRRQNDQR